MMKTIFTLIGCRRRQTPTQKLTKTAGFEPGPGRYFIP
jgi:hypothetical protein